MSKKQRKEETVNNNDAIIKSEETEVSGLEKNKSTLKDLLAPSGVDASHYDYLEIFSKISRYARTFYITTLPRQATFPYFLSGIYDFGDVTTSVYITPISETTSQNDLNKQIVELQSERYVAHDRGDINRESILTAKQAEAESLRDQIAAGYNKLFDATIICTLFAYSKDELDKYSELLAMEASKNLISLKTAWALQEEGFKSNLPLDRNTITRKHTFDRGSMATVFPFVSADAGHEIGVPIGINKQTGLPLLFDNFSSKMTNYNMIIFGKSGAGKSVTIKTIMARSAVLMGVENLVLDAEGEYVVVAEALRGINVNISPTSDTIINIFDIEPELVKDEITGKEKYVLNVENKVEDATQALLTMARGTTKSDEVNELTKQIIGEIVAEEYKEKGITSDPESLYEIGNDMSSVGRVQKDMPTITSWYERLEKKAAENTNTTYEFHYNYLTKVMKQYCKKFNGQMAYFDGQSTFELQEGSLFININISQLEERFARPLAQQILLSWIWEKYVKKNSEDKSKAKSKRVLVDEAWMLLAYPEAVDFLNTMARRARKRNVSLTVVSQKFQDFYENKSVQAVLTSAETKLFLAQDKSEIDYLKEVFKLSEGEANFLLTCTRGEGLLKIGYESAVIAIKPTQREFEFVETNLNKLKEKNRANL
ncbi:type IV secretory pathway VirB4 components-like protein [Clostridium sp. CAG:1219]|nr:type IV secretory pathway VirB4 components-like protein [Clostridium sp. CAG:1219]